MKKLFYLILLISLYMASRPNLVIAAQIGPGGVCNPATDTCPRGYICEYDNPETAASRTCLPITSQGGGVDIGRIFSFNFSSGNAPQTLGGFVSSILPQIYILALIILLVYLIWGSYKYLLSGGDPKAVSGAKSHITWAIIGMIIIVLSYGILQLINSMLGYVY